MLILAILVLGLAAGWIAHLLVGRGEPDWTRLFLVGVVGSFVGGLLGSLLFGDGLELRPTGLIGSAVGATLVLALAQWVRGRSTDTSRRRRRR
ncbi:membrane protein [Actinotalea ferrariae CF5-4]|uniref:Membrane protein n=1 Tax=Actinotalea ferrariae CF5-4 TaxID=948458 RepID=A0A021VSE9_9CELL|nr:GlsB/YeaQ/YmgE family stress response membrane protein [Actinotalea ferrariae]EYR64053.1 membrane protein [Actinotalea ferrariae CF5-4]